MKKFVVLISALLSFSLSASPNLNLQRSLENIDFSRLIEDEDMVFAPFDWTTGNRGVMWYKTYKYQLDLGDVDAKGTKTGTLYLIAKAHTDQARSYHDFVRKNQIRDEGLRIYRDEQPICKFHPDFESFMSKIIGRVPKIDSYGDSRVLCQTTFRFADGWDSEIQQYINLQKVFAITQKLPLCEANSPSYSGAEISKTLINQDILEESLEQYYGDLFRLIYGSVILSQTNSSLFGSDPESVWQRYFKKFKIDVDQGIASTAKDEADQLIKDCIDRSIPITVGD